MVACKIPCPECPFTKSSLPGYLGGVYDNAQELHNIVMNDLPFPCHTAQKDRIVAWSNVGNKNNPLCAGAIGYMRKNFKRPRNLEIAQLVQEFKTDKLENILSVPEFIEHHNKFKKRI